MYVGLEHFHYHYCIGGSRWISWFWSTTSHLSKTCELSRRVSSGISTMFGTNAVMLVDLWLSRVL